MADIRRYDICAVIGENRNGEYVLYSDHEAALAEAVALRNQCSHGIRLHEELQDEVDALTALICEALDGNLSPSASNPDLAPTGQRGSLSERMKAAIDQARKEGV